MTEVTASANAKGEPIIPMPIIIVIIAEIFENKEDAFPKKEEMP